MTTQTNQLIQAIATVELTAADGQNKRPRVRIVAYAGGIMEVPGWGPVVIDLAGLDRPNQTPLLADHDNRLSGIVGHGKPAIENNQLTISGTLLDTEAAHQIVQLSAGGLELKASVGVKPTIRRYVRESEKVQVNGRTSRRKLPSHSSRARSSQKCRSSPSAQTTTRPFQSRPKDHRT